MIDTASGRARSYHNPEGQTAAALTDLRAFAAEADPAPPGPVTDIRVPWPAAESP